MITASITDINNVVIKVSPHITFFLHQREVKLASELTPVPITTVIIFLLLSHLNVDFPSSSYVNLTFFIGTRVIFATAAGALLILLHHYPQSLHFQLFLPPQLDPLPLPSLPVTHHYPLQQGSLQVTLHYPQHFP